jgi:protein phosphatase
MATTLTLWIGVWPRAYLLHVGDSRCYLLREGRLIQLSRDQSSSLGGPETAPVVTAMEQDWNNVGLLCSDGPTKHVPDDCIRERLLAMTSAKGACEELLHDALDAGGSDNITVIVGRTVRKDGP